jgi:hypothetical protein
MDEGNAAVDAMPWPAVNQLDPPFIQLAERLFDVRHSERDVVERLSVPSKKPCDAGIGCDR